jgi:hypothetical protein
MSSSEHENELAELLREVRALRQDIAQLKAGRSEATARPPGYAVLARTEGARDPNYEVLVREFLPPDYAVLVRPQLQEPSYEVLVRQAFEPGNDPTAAGS